MAALFLLPLRKSNARKYRGSSSAGVVGSTMIFARSSGVCAARDLQMMSRPALDEAALGNSFRYADRHSSQCLAAAIPSASRYHRSSPRYCPASVAHSAAGAASPVKAIASSRRTLGDCAAKSSGRPSPGRRQFAPGSNCHDLQVVVRLRAPRLSGSRCPCREACSGATRRGHGTAGSGRRGTFSPARLRRCRRTDGGPSRPGSAAS